MTKNINYVSHKKSKLKTNDGKPQLPSASSLVEGEIAVNYAEDVETLSIKNESGTVVTFSSDNYYTKEKLGSAFTNNNVTVAEELDLIGEATAAALNDLDNRINEVEIIASSITDKADTSAMTLAITEATSGKADSSTVAVVNNALTAHTTNTTMSAI